MAGLYQFENGFHFHQHVFVAVAFRHYLDLEIGFYFFWGLGWSNVDSFGKFIFYEIKFCTVVMREIIFMILFLKNHPF